MYLEFTLMPTYQYICNECEHAFEAVQAFSDEPLTTCPECGKSIRKIYSNVGIVFKGSGFYKTDSQKTTKPAPTSAPASTPATPTKSESLISFTHDAAVYRLEFPDRVSHQVHDQFHPV